MIAEQFFHLEFKYKLILSFKPKQDNLDSILLLSSIYGFIYSNCRYSSFFTKNVCFIFRILGHRRNQNWTSLQ